MIKELWNNVIENKGKRLFVTAIVVNTLSSLLSACIMLAIFLMLEQIIAGQKDVQNYWWTLLAIVAGKFICNIVAGITSHFAGFEMEVNLKEKIIRKLKQFSLGFYTNERLGEISTVVQGDVEGLEDAIVHFGSKALSDILIALVIGFAMFILDWRMGLVMVSLLPVAVWIHLAGLGRTLRLRGTNSRNLADMVSLFVEYTKGIPLLKAFPENQCFRNNLKESAANFGKSSKAEAKVGAVDTAKFFIPFELCFGLLALAGALLTLEKSLNTNTYIYFIVFSLEFYKPFANLELYRINYTKIKDSYGRISKLLNTDIVKNPENPQTPSRFDICFEHVDFRYDDSSFEMKDIHFTLPQGTITALVGLSGSGKTTITSLLLRFWDIQAGKITIGGVDIRDINYDELLSMTSIVMQNVILFADTIYENIRMGNQKATREEVIAAAKKAMIHDFIAGLPQGYDTLLGENGAGLSGGQKQRLSIARAFMKDSPVVLLDEITSNVDSLNEVAIQQAIGNLAVGRTVIVIAHHLKTICSADKILVFDAGRIAEHGTHDELLRQKALYHTLWTAQEDAKVWNVSTLR